MNATEMKISHPSQWPTKTINEACELVSRGTAPSYVEHSAVLVIGQRCVREVGFQSGEARFHDQRSVTRVLEVRKGDVLLNSTGTGTIGRSCIFNADGVYIVDGHVTLLRSTPGQLDGRWLNALFQSPQGQIYLETQCYSGSTNQVELSRRNLLATSIPLPPLLEQRRIAEILDTIDEAIQKTEVLISKLKAMKQGLLQDLLTRGLEKNGKLRDPKAHPEQFKDSPLGRIPKEWVIGGIDQFLSPTDGIKPGPFGSSITKRMYTAEGYKVYGQEQVIADDLTVGDYYISPDKFNELKIFEIQENDILVSLVGTVGCVLVVRRPFKPGIINPRLIRFRPILSKGNPVFLKELLMSDIVKGQLASLFQGGTMPVLSAATMRKLILFKPKEYEQEMIAKVLVAHDSRIRTEEQYRDKLKLQKKGLMHDLLTGKVRVKT